MRLSKKGEYAVRALIEIGFESTARPNSLIQISTVAQRTNIPEKFLEQILLALRNGGVLKSKRGVEGGYSLAKTPGRHHAGRGGAAARRAARADPVRQPFRLREVFVSR